MKRTRQSYNEEILNILDRAIYEHPDWRFGQILVNYGVVEPGTDPFFDESERTLKDMSINIHCQALLRKMKEGN